MLQPSSPLALLSSEELMRLQRRRRTKVRKRNNTIYTHNCKHSMVTYNAEEEEVHEDVDDEEIYMIPIASPSSTRTRTTSRRWDQQLQHPRRRRCYRQQEEDSIKDKHQPLVFLERRRITRSISLSDNNNKERPCMKKTTGTRCAMADCPILRPYRKLSSDYLQCLGEQLEESIGDCACDYDLDNPANETFPAIPMPVAFTTNIKVSSEDQFSKKNMDYKKRRNSALLSHKSIVDCPCMAESTTSTSCNNNRGSLPMSLLLGLPIMPRRQLSAHNLCINDILFNPADDDENEEGGGDNE